MNDDQRYQRFADFYHGDTPPPWDSGIVPPEVRDFVTGGTPPGVAVDVGCGTGVSSIYLADNGWQVTGIDWIEAALEMARHRAADAGKDASNPQFVRANAGSADFLPDHPPLDLWLDVGCLHGFPLPERRHYAAHAARLVRPGGTLLLYAHGLTDNAEIPGLTTEDMRDLFGAAFDFVAVDTGVDMASGHPRPSAWYTLRRQP